MYFILSKMSEVQTVMGHNCLNWPHLLAIWMVHSFAMVTIATVMTLKVEIKFDIFCCVCHLFVSLCLKSLSMVVDINKKGQTLCNYMIINFYGVAPVVVSWAKTSVLSHGISILLTFFSPQTVAIFVHIQP